MDPSSQTVYRSKILCYSELILLPTFQERFEYLKLNGVVGEETFRWMRFINQNFYNSQEWKKIRDSVIIRDNGCDLGIEPFYLPTKGIIVHHMNPITVDDLVNRTRLAIDPEYLISVSLNTHNAIHYGDASKLRQELVVRRPNDTCPWKD